MNAVASNEITVEPWRLFPVTVSAVTRLSPTFVRVTLTGQALESFADNGFDQRIELILPARGHRVELPAAGDWDRYRRGLPTEVRPVVRTYAVRAARPADREVDVDIALHGEIGYVSRWATRVHRRDEVVLYGPDARYPGRHGGLEFQPPTPLPRLLLAGDETAVSAIAAILERLPRDARGQALLEVPSVEDALPLSGPAGVMVTWLARGSRPVGARLVPAVAVATADFGRQPAPVDFGRQPASADFGRQPASADFGRRQEDSACPDDVYAWLAGEASVIRLLHRHLVVECRLDRRSVTAMGYWRLDRPESD